MKKILTALFSMAVLAAAGQTADEVIQKYSANLGGLEAFEKVTTAKMSGTASAQGYQFPITTQIINNKASRTEVDVMGQMIVQVYNNGAAWKINPLEGNDSPVEVTGTELNEFKIQSSLANNLMDYKNRGHKVEFAGQEKVEGIDCYKLKLTTKEEGKLTTYYISTSDYTLIKSVNSRNIQGQDVEIETFYSDFKEINGLKFSMMRDQKIMGQPYQSIKLEKIELNVPVDESIFKM